MIIGFVFAAVLPTACHFKPVPRAQRSYPVFGQVAQSVEQRIENPRVGGSIPSLATNNFKDLAHKCLGPFSCPLTRVGTM